jgi:hypothetical protein
MAHLGGAILCDASDAGEPQPGHTYQRPATSHLKQCAALGRVQDVAVAADERDERGAVVGGQGRPQYYATPKSVTGRRMAFVTSH